MSDRDEKPIDFFELVVALLLGMGAIGGAWSAYQSDLWGGQSQEAYGEAATQATRASTLFNLGVTQLVRDLSLDIDAKKLVVEGMFTQDEATRTRVMTVASYLYAQQMSDQGYAVIGLSPRWRTEEGREGVDHIPVEELTTTLERELGDNAEYVGSVLGEGTTAFQLADSKFDSGRRANEIGDRFGLVGVLYTVALFLAGIALVFKSGVKWAFAALGAIMLGLSSVALFVIPWAGGFPWAPATEQAPPAVTAPAAPPAPAPVQPAGKAP